MFPCYQNHVSRVNCSNAMLPQRNYLTYGSLAQQQVNPFCWVAMFVGNGGQFAASIPGYFLVDYEFVFENPQGLIGSGKTTVTSTPTMSTAYKSLFKHRLRDLVASSMYSFGVPLGYVRTMLASNRRFSVILLSETQATDTDATLTPGQTFTVDESLPLLNYESDSTKLIDASGVTHLVSDSAPVAIYETISSAADYSTNPAELMYLQQLSGVFYNNLANNLTQVWSIYGSITGPSSKTVIQRASSKVIMKTVTKDTIPQQLTQNFIEAGRRLFAIPKDHYDDVAFTVFLAAETDTAEPLAYWIVVQDLDSKSVGFLFALAEICNATTDLDGQNLIGIYSEVEGRGEIDCYMEVGYVTQRGTFNVGTMATGGLWSTTWTDNYISLYAPPTNGFVYGVENNFRCDWKYLADTLRAARIERNYRRRLFSLPIPPKDIAVPDETEPAVLDFDDMHPVDLLDGTDDEDAQDEGFHAPDTVILPPMRMHRGEELKRRLAAPMVPPRFK